MGRDFSIIFSIFRYLSDIIYHIMYYQFDLLVDDEVHPRPRGEGEVGHCCDGRHVLGHWAHWQQALLGTLECLFDPVAQLGGISCLILINILFLSTQLMLDMVVCKKPVSQSTAMLDTSYHTIVSISKMLGDGFWQHWHLLVQHLLELISSHSWSEHETLTLKN